MESIWIPSKGTMPLHVRAVSKSIEEYDARLSLGKDKHTGDWVVLRENGPDGIPHFPVFALGQELPSADDVKRELFNRDMARNGTRIVQSIKDAQNKRRADAKSHADDGAFAAAQVLEHSYRAMGGDGANTKVFIPRGI